MHDVDAVVASSTYVAGSLYRGVLDREVERAVELVFEQGGAIVGRRGLGHGICVWRRRSWTWPMLDRSASRKSLSSRYECAL
jgi:hypothetical protein